mgnify:FL=1
MQKLMGYAAAEYVVKTILNSKFTEMITPFYNFNLIEADPDDNKFVDCASQRMPNVLLPMTIIMMC